MNDDTKVVAISDPSEQEKKEKRTFGLYFRGKLRVRGMSADEANKALADRKAYLASKGS